MGAARVGRGQARGGPTRDPASGSRSLSTAAASRQGVPAGACRSRTCAMLHPPKSSQPACRGPSEWRMPRLQRRSFTTPDEVRQFAQGRVDVVELDDNVVGRLVYEPGWRWSTDVGPLAGTATLPVPPPRLRVSRPPARRDGRRAPSSRSGPATPSRSRRATTPGSSATSPGSPSSSTSARTFGAPPDAHDERILATILFTDIVDSTATLAPDRRRRLAASSSRAQRRVRERDRTVPRPRGGARPATGSWRCSTAPPGRSAARRR